MVEVFKTNIDNDCIAQKVEKMLVEKFQNIRINFDLEDCDRILRIEGNKISVAEIRVAIQNLNLICEVLE